MLGYKIAAKIHPLYLENYILGNIFSKTCSPECKYLGYYSLFAML